MKLGVVGAPFVGAIVCGALWIAAPAAAAPLDCSKIILKGHGPSFWTPDPESGVSEAALFDPNLRALRTDAFDSSYDASELNGVDYLNPSTPDCRKVGAHTLRYPTQTVGAIALTPSTYIDPKRPFARLFTTLKNTLGVPVLVDFGWDGDNLGSDSNTRVGRTSSGDAAATASDTWATTCEDLKANGCKTTKAERVHDPEIAHNWERQGKKKESADVVTFTNGEDNTEVVYQGVTIPPGRTVAFMEILTLARTIKQANSAANLTAKKPARAGAFRGLSKTQRNKLLNW